MKPLDVNVDVNLTDIVTPKSCSVIICELIKHLLYQREHIPYTYERLKFIITKRKELMTKPQEEDECNISLHSRIAAERQYNTAEETFQNLENAFRNIQAEFQEQSVNVVDEVVIIFGSTPQHPQNIFKIQIPQLTIGHKDENHPYRKQLPSLFQSLISSEGLHKVLNKKISPTNLFILLKTKEDLDVKSEIFHKKDDYQIPVRTAHINFIIKCEKSSKSCSCDPSGFPVFCDTPSRHFNVINNLLYTVPISKTDETVSSSNVNENDEVNDDLNCNWFQFNHSIKGFKECRIEGVSVANLWLKYTKPSSLTS